MHNNKKIYLMVFLAVMIFPWVSNYFCCHNYSILFMGVLSLFFYFMNFSFFIWAVLTMKKHDVKELLPFSFNCFGSLLFFILKIDWLESQFYMTHGNINALLWLSAHILSGYGHLTLQINYLHKVNNPHVS